MKLRSTTRGTLLGLTTLGLTLLLAVSGCSAADEQEPLDFTSDELVVPMRYDFDSYMKAHHGASKGTKFSFAPAPELGVVIHEAFISANDVQIAPKGALKFEGDNREHSATFDPTRTRAFLVLDFPRGRGWFIVNPSHVTACLGVCKTKEMDARAVHNSYEGGNTWIYANWADPDTFRVRISMLVSIPGGALMGCSADHQLLINKKTGAVQYEGDKFPSTGTYRLGVRTPRTLQQTHETSPSDLCGEPRFSFGVTAK